MFPLMLRAALLLSLLILPACAFARQDQNEPLNAEAFAMLKPGETTAGEAVTLLGAPMDVVQIGRRSAYRWDFTEAKTAATVLIVFNMVNQDTRQDRIWLFFDENNVLSHKGGTFEGHRAQYAFPWEDLYEESDRREDDAYRNGVPVQAGK